METSVPELCWEGRRNPNGGFSFKIRMILGGHPKLLHEDNKWASTLPGHRFCCLAYVYSAGADLGLTSCSQHCAAPSCVPLQDPG